MTDTRPEMTLEQFEAASTYSRGNHWLTGEDSFLHVPAVMQVDGWNIYGSSGNDSLTGPQRALMMWSDLVGQTCNGGFEQFAYNFRHALAPAYQLIAQLEWPELLERFDRAFREQAGEPSAPALVHETWYDQPRADQEDPPAEEAKAFDDWFFLDETRQASRKFIGDYIRRHRDDLCRLTG